MVRVGSVSVSSMIVTRCVGGVSVSIQKHGSNARCVVVNHGYQAASHISKQLSHKSLLH